MKEAAEDKETKKDTFLVIYVNNNLFFLQFADVELYINNQEVYISNKLYAHIFYFSEDYKVIISEYKRVCAAKCMTTETFLMRF